MWRWLALFHTRREWMSCRFVSCVLQRCCRCYCYDGLLLVRPGAGTTAIQCISRIPQPARHSQHDTERRGWSVWASMASYSASHQVHVECGSDHLELAVTTRDHGQSMHHDSQHSLSVELGHFRSAVWHLWIPQRPDSGQHFQLQSACQQVSGCSFAPHRTDDDPRSGRRSLPGHLQATVPSQWRQHSSSDCRNCCHLDHVRRRVNDRRRGRGDQLRWTTTYTVFSNVGLL